jgi:hypothetical protein
MPHSVEEDNRDITTTEFHVRIYAEEEHHEEEDTITHAVNPWDLVKNAIENAPLSHDRMIDLVNQVANLQEYVEHFITKYQDEEAKS